MENYLAKMKEYLNMDSELPYDQFSEYFQEFINYLKEDYDKFDQDTCLKAKFISSILNANSMDRSKRKGPEAKKYKKMSEKSKLWVDAINYRLLKEGLTQEKIDSEIEAISESM